MSAFTRSLAYLLPEEGGFSDRPSDPGGRTLWGVTQASYDRHRVRKGLERRDVKAMTADERDAIYHEDYWLSGRCDELFWPCSLLHFDALVQHGPGKPGKVGAVHLLQRAAGVKDDGVWGPITTGAIEETEPLELAHRMLHARYDHYWGLLLDRPSRLTDNPGWRHRLRNLGRAAGIVRAA